MLERTHSIYQCLISMRFFWLFIFVQLTSISIFAQQFNTGASFGVNASQVSGDGYSGFDKAGLTFGVFSNTRFSEKIYFQFEINYSGKGSRKSARPHKGDNEFFLMRMAYVDLPVMVQFHKKRMTYEAGFYYSRLFSSYLEDENGEFEIESQLEQFKKNDIGFLFGLNFNFTDNLVMNWRFNSSITPFRDFDSGSNTLPFDSGMYHHYASFTMRYLFLGAYGK